MVSNIQTIGALGSSDHQAIICNVHAKIFICGDNKQFLPAFKKADFNGMREEIASYSWDEFLESKNASESWDSIVNIINELSEKHIPKRSLKKNTKPVWLTRKALREVRKKHNLWISSNIKIMNMIENATKVSCIQQSYELK